MSIPKYDDLMQPVLTYLANNGMQYWRSLEKPLAQGLGLTEAEVAEEYASGNGTVFLDRISWALSHMSLAQLIERPKRGFYQITEAGKLFVGDAEKLKQFVRTKINERNATRQVADISIDQAAAKEVDFSEATPQEVLNQAYETIKNAEAEKILDTILSKTPYEFEKLVVKLLDKMGYGGQVKDAGFVTKASNDGGIDGVIKEDVLGLGKIHIQAKRYARDKSISREDIQKFVGALAVAQSNKGVFITTSYFTKGAIEYVRSLNANTTIVLIDGETLADYIYHYSLGMQVEQVIEIKRMDADFWDSMIDEVKA